MVTATRFRKDSFEDIEERVAALEGAEDAFATASGMAAVSGALSSMLKAGDHVVSARALFGSCLYVLEDILTRFGVEVTFVDGADLAQWEAAIRPDTRPRADAKIPKNVLAAMSNGAGAPALGAANK